MTNYEDIINLPHHTSKKYPRMDRAVRACQFAPFSALTGHETAVKETARLTDCMIELDEYEILRINDTLFEVLDNISEKPKVKLKYFKPDNKKSGGEYVTIMGRVKKFKNYNRILEMSDGEEIEINSILEFEMGEF